jgi:hypothetical protein
MAPLLSMLLTVAALAAVVLAFRMVLRRPRGLTSNDPPGVRTVAIFAGSDPEFFRDDRPEKLLVGIRLFGMLCDGLAARGITIQKPRNVQNAQGADCVVGAGRFTMVLEWLEEGSASRWVLGIDYRPRSGAERRHLALTHQVFSPPDSPELRQLLATIHAWLAGQRSLSEITWHRKQDWLTDNTASPAPGPITG